MKTIKTPRKQRESYVIILPDENLEPHTKKLLPGEDGVTDEWIRILHSMDDSQIYYNRKAMLPGCYMSENKKHELDRQKKAWREGFIAGFIAAYGYAPHELDVRDAEQKVFPKDYVLSLEGFIGEIEDEKTLIPGNIYGNETDDTCMDCLHDLIKSWKATWQFIYQKALLEGYSHLEVASMLGVSRQRVDILVRKIIKQIKLDKNISSFFREA